uniref:Uncharacterized protein n=1 Tax=Romanomermis culicivorax TaxID=13658 RepID=A0A915L7P0_ROMCU
NPTASYSDITSSKTEYSSFKRLTVCSGVLRAEMTENPTTSDKSMLTLLKVSGSHIWPDFRRSATALKLMRELKGIKIISSMFLIRFVAQDGADFVIFHSDQDALVVGYIFITLGHGLVSFVGCHRADCAQRTKTFAAPALKSYDS